MEILKSKDISKSNEKKISSNADKLNSKDLGNVLKVLIQSKKEYEITKEQETTKRKVIENDMIKYLKTLDAKKEFLSKAFEEEYSIRKDTIEKMFNLIEKALDEGSDNIVIAALDSIEKIVKESPLKGLAQIASAFENDDEDLII
ncbi:hypothetical protein K9O30_06620 [Clostridium bowmanii]|uniref:hypothetical protein n=1 Tax=Clostridium bowmanii TaxID=132925 RepID=UPI001C0E873B|nr:hypothetical protein [Clostridium bowmanii]MBU3191296.1 hypothetical protein [Clostridium bowmanii]MCA1073413.1 hypothetical protein [Clostridium bowmanii]